MAAKTPVTTKTTAGYVDPRHGVYGTGPNTKRLSTSVAQTATNNLVTDVDDHHFNRNGLILSIFYFGPSNSANDIDDGDTWTSGLPGIVAVAWQPADATDDPVGVSCTNRVTGVIDFQSGGTNHQGWLWVLHGS